MKIFNHIRMLEIRCVFPDCDDLGYNAHFHLAFN